MQHVFETFVERQRRAEREDHDRDDKAPEIDLLAVAKRKTRTGRSPRRAQSIKQQDLVAGVHQRVDALGEHRSATGNGGGAKLGHRDQAVAYQRRIDRFL